MLVSIPAGAQEHSAKKPRKVADKKFWLAVGLSVAAAVADAEFSVRAGQRCRAAIPNSPCRDVLLGANLSRGRAYGVILPLKAAETFLSYKLKARESGELRRGWWLPQFIGGGVNVIGAAGSATTHYTRVCPANGAGCAR